MKTELLNEVIDCLPKGRTHFRYYKGAYAPKLLSLLIPESASLRVLKQSRFNRLLNQPLVKPVLAQCGDGMLRRANLNNIWQEPSLPFLLSLGRWGGTDDRGWYQTSRFGENLVLQLNLPLENQRKYTRWMDPSGYDTLNGHWTSHPVQLRENNPRFRDTLAWSRIDIDFKHDEALIEEVQSDSVRDVKRWAKNYRKCKCQECQTRLQYIDWFEAYSTIWAEAMLTASICFIKEELGINRIFMHTARSGSKVKKIDTEWQPPKSLYSDLPRKFAFKQTWAAPEFLLESKCYRQLIRKQPDIDFYQLTLDELKHERGVRCH